MREVRVLNSELEAAQTAAEFIYGLVSEHRDSRRFTLALSGGNTPKLMYRELSAIPNIGQLLSERVEIFFSDERAVPPDSTESNYHTALAGLFQPLGLPGIAIHRIKGEADDRKTEALRYSRLISEKVESGIDGMPRFDLILLGMGADGHTASLFPELKVRLDDPDPVLVNFINSLQAWRYSFSPALLNASKRVLFLVTGAAKAQTVKKVLSAGADGLTLPAAMIVAEKTVWMLDRAASALLEQADR
jgi:6-phosphogluconolactonase